MKVGAIRFLDFVQKVGAFDLGSLKYEVLLELHLWTSSTSLEKGVRCAFVLLLCF